MVVDTQDPEPVKHRTPEEQEAEDAYNMMMMTLDNGPHREMAVDVPDTFIARSKTPPRYPPPKPQCRLQVCPNLVVVSGPVLVVGHNWSVSNKPDPYAESLQSKLDSVADQGHDI